MCGRYTTDGVDVAKLAERFAAQPRLEDFAPNPNLKPTQTAPVVFDHDGARDLALMQWGLVPFWAKDTKIGAKMFNARAETIADKPAFKNAFKRKRCLVPATGFYEWKPEGRSKVPYRFTVGDHELFSFAGLYETWRTPGGETLYTYTIITTTPNELVADVHDRMPVLLPPDAEQPWLDPSLDDPMFLQTLLQPFPADAMQMHKVEGLFDQPRPTPPVANSQ